MSPSPAGLIGPPILAGHVLDGAGVAEQDHVIRRVKALTPLATGGLREGWAYWGDGYPLGKLKLEVTLRYEHIRVHYDLVEWILAGPGPHEFVAWKSVHLQYLGDGQRTEFTLPWLIATDFYSPPAGVAAAAVAPAAQTDPSLESTALTITKQSAAAYAAGEPTAGNLWTLDQGQVFKVSSLGSGVPLYLRYVPILPMFEGAEVQKRYRSATIREPRDIQLREQ